MAGLRTRRTLTLLGRASRAFVRPRRTLHAERFAGGHLLVTEDGAGRRCLQFGPDGASQSEVWPGYPLHLVLAYARAMVAGLAFVAEPRRLLVVGVGGGAVPMFLRAVLPEAHIDAVDRHPEVLEVARRYFGFREDAALRAHVADGRRFLEAPGPTYDAIFLDAYGSRHIPRHLTTREFLQAVQTRLAPGGALVGNVWRSPNPLFPSMVRTYREGFARLHAFDVTETANRILVGLPRSASPSRAMLQARIRQLGRERGVPFDLGAMVADACEDEALPPEAEVLRDG